MSYPHASSEEGRNQIFEDIASQVPVERTKETEEKEEKKVSGEFDKGALLAIKDSFNNARIGKPFRGF